MKAEQIAVSGYSCYLKPLDTFLRNFLGSSYAQTEEEKRALVKGRSIQFTYRGRIEVDLLVSPNWRNQCELYSFLMRVQPEDRNKLSSTECLLIIIYMVTVPMIVQIYCICIQVAG